MTQTVQPVGRHIEVQDAVLVGALTRLERQAHVGEAVAQRLGIDGDVNQFTQPVVAYLHFLMV